MFKTLRGRITATYFLVVIISLVLASLVFLFFLARYNRNRDRTEMRDQVGALATDISRINQSLSESLVAPDRQELEANILISSFLSTEARVLGMKLALVSPRWTVVAESRGRPNFGLRSIELPEDIFSGVGPRVSEHYFPALGRRYMFATSPTDLAAGESGYLLAIKPLEQVGSVAASLIWYVILAGLIALGISMVFAFYLSSAISKQVRAVTEAARRMAAGDYGQEVEVTGSDETAELARDFNMMAERVRTAYEQQRNFVGNVSHELRTPLTSIEGFSQALLDGVSASAEEQRRSLEIINQESKRMVRLLRDLLLLSQIDAGELTPERRPVDVVKLIRELGSLYGGRAEEEEIDFRQEPPDEPLTIWTDPDRLERVLTNLLDNALKYTGSGGAVTLSARRDDDLARFSVTDTGPGIPPELLRRIFDRFYRVEQSRAQKHGGSGLGLAICKELVETMGGTIDVNSSVGQGTTFTVALPSGAPGEEGHDRDKEQGR
jgi:signal transduction histidine kinase